MTVHYWIGNDGERVPFCRQQLRFGDRNVSSSADDVGVQLRNISATTIHPKYQFPFSYFDVAVWEASEPLVMTNYIHPICLPNAPSDDVDKYENDHVTLTGWGKQALNELKIDGLLKQSPIKIYSQRYSSK